MAPVKLTLEKSGLHKGAVHVRAGKLVKVVLEHEVSLEGLDRAQPAAVGAEAEPPQFVPGQKVTTAKVDDLAIEIVSVKTQRVIGHSYLNGGAVRVNRYGPAMVDWFADASMARLDMSSPHDFDDAVGMIFAARNATVDLVLLGVQDAADPQAVMRFVGEWLYAVDESGKATSPATADVVVLIAGLRDRRNRWPFALITHQQPSRAVSWGMTLFQARLAMTTPCAAELQHQPASSGAS